MNRTWFVILLCFVVYCFLVSVSIADEGTELFNCRSVDAKLLVEKIPELVSVGVELGSDLRLCWSEGFVEIGGGSVESLPAHKINLDQFHAGFGGKPRTQGGATKASEDGSNSTDDSNISGSHDEEVSLQFVIMYAILLLILMVFSWGLGLWAFIFLTKRRSQCPPNPQHLLSSE